MSTSSSGNGPPLSLMAHAPDALALLSAQFGNINRFLSVDGNIAMLSDKHKYHALTIAAPRTRVRPPLVTVRRASTVVPNTIGVFLQHPLDHQNHSSQTVAEYPGVVMSLEMHDRFNALYHLPDRRSLSDTRLH